MKKLLFILSVFCFTAINGQPVASPNSVFKLIDGATFFGAGGVLVTFENLHVDNQGYLNHDSINLHINPGASIFRFSGDSTTYMGAPLTWPRREPDFVFDRLKVAKTSGAILQLGRNIYINSSIDFASGLLDLNDNDIFLYGNGNAVLNGESETSRVIDGSESAGGLIMVIAHLTANTTINPGNLGLEITPSASSINVPISSGSRIWIYRGHHSQDQLSQSGQILNQKSVLRYYRIITCWSTNYNDCFNQGGNFNAKVRFKYFNGELNGINKNMLSMWQSRHSPSWQTPQGTPWAHVGLSANDTTNNYVEQTVTLTDQYSYLTLAPGPVSPRPANPAGQHLTNSPGLSNEKNSWKIWSNPVSKTLSIIIHTTNKSKVITNIYDSKGALIQTKQDHLLTGKNVINIDTRGIAAGIYYIQSQWSDGQARASGSFVKQ